MSSIQANKMISVEDMYRRSYFFTPGFNGKLSELSILLQNKGRITPVYFGTLKDVINSSLHKFFKSEVLDVGLVFSTNVNGHYISDAAIGTDPKTGKRVVAYNPDQAEAGYVRSLLHEIKHELDTLAGKTWEAHDFSTVNDYYKPEEIRSRRFEESFVPKTHRKLYPVDTPNKASTNWYIKAQNEARSLKSDLITLLPQMAQAAQAIYDDWQQDADGMDEEFGGGGICDHINQAISNLISEMVPVDFVIEGGQDGDDHSWAIVRRGTETYGVDLSACAYESGGGYNWKKKPDVTITPDMIAIFPVDIPDDYDPEFQ